PDLSFAAYLAGPKIGAIAYNAVHSTIVPMGMLAVGFGFAPPLVLSLALIWLSHIGLDRALGYGLKYGGWIWIDPSRADRQGKQRMTGGPCATLSRPNNKGDVMHKTLRAFIAVAILSSGIAGVAFEA